MFHIHICGQPEHWVLNAINLVLAWPEMVPMLRPYIAEWRARLGGHVSK